MNTNARQHAQVMEKQAVGKIEVPDLGSLADNMKTVNGKAEF